MPHNHPRTFARSRRIRGQDRASDPLGQRRSAFADRSGISTKWRVRRPIEYDARRSTRFLRNNPAIATVSLYRRGLQQL
jgi:hypothetical protein